MMLRLTFSIALSALFVVACGDDSRSGTDSGLVVGIDGGGRDSGPGVDSGPGMDGGGTDGMVTPGTCGGAMCDLVTGGGCMTGQACQLLAAAAGEMPEGMCVPSGTLGDGAACTMATDCQEGFACVVPAGSGAGTCQHYCCPMAPGANAACPTGQSCMTTFQDTDVGYCSFPDDCDPIAQTGCDAGEGCYLAMGGTFACAVPAGDAGGTGHPCAFINDCMPGYACIDDMCAELCTRPDGTECDAPAVCNGVTGFTTVGVCIAPAT